MKFKRLSVVMLACLGFTAVTAYANEVQLTVDQPTKLAFQIAHKNKGGQPVFGAVQTVQIDKDLTIPIDLNGYDVAGVAIVSANGHALPTAFTQFDQVRQCSMATDKTKPTGKLAFTVTAHSISCSTSGGIYG